MSTMRYMIIFAFVAFIGYAGWQDTKAQVPPCDRAARLEAHPAAHIGTLVAITECDETGYSAPSRGTTFPLTKNHWVSAEHVIDGYDRADLFIVTGKDEVLRVDRIMQHPHYDFVILHVKAQTKLDPLKARGMAPHEGEMLTAWGPNEDAAQALSYESEIEDRIKHTDHRLYRLRGTVYPGYSGGPVLDREGNVVAVSIASEKYDGEVEGHAALAVPIHAINEIAQAEKSRTS